MAGGATPTQNSEALGPIYLPYSSISQHFQVPSATFTEQPASDPECMLYELNKRPYMRVKGRPVVLFRGQAAMRVYGLPWRLLKPRVVATSDTRRD